MSRRIFHVVFADDWAGAQRFGEYEGSTRAKTLDEVGFIHAATAEQLEHVLTAVYRDADLPLVVAVIDEDALREAGVDTRWEEIPQSSSTPGTTGPAHHGRLAPDSGRRRRRNTSRPQERREVDGSRRLGLRRRRFDAVAGSALVA